MVLAASVFGGTWWLENSITAQQTRVANLQFVRSTVVSESTVKPFSRMDLSGQPLSGLDLGDADLTDADLIDADLIDADLTNADLTDANLSDVRGYAQ